jgi:threonine dehydrogenase-like Zn-dependent dehydrogenase
MRAVRALDGEATVVDEAWPEGKGLTVKVASAGICGSDLHLLDWNIPVVLGHEMAGTLADGTPVAVEPIDPCWSCEACASGAYNLCGRGPSMVLGVGRDGGLAEACVVPERSLTPLPGGTSLADACLIEPLAVAVHAVRRGCVSGGQRVAIVGGGSLGQLAVVAAQACGAEVSMAARHESQIEVARQLGAGPVDQGYDVVIEAAGTATALARAVELCRAGGTVVAVGSYWDAPTMPALDMGTREISLVPSSMYGRTGPSRDFDTAAALLAARPDVPGLVITHRFPLDAAAEAFAAARDRASGSIKVVIEP